MIWSNPIPGSTCEGNENRSPKRCMPAHVYCSVMYKHLRGWRNGQEEDSSRLVGKKKKKTSNDRKRERFWEGSFAESARWGAIGGTWPQDMTGSLAGRNWGWNISAQLSGRFLLSRGRRENQRNASCCYSWKALNGQVETFVRGKIERKSLKAKTAWWLFSNSLLEVQDKGMPRKQKTWHFKENNKSTHTTLHGQLAK